MGVSAIAQASFDPLLLTKIMELELSTTVGGSK